MGIVVQTNVPSLVAQSNLNKATNDMNTAMERMSTGYKINSAKDDAAGLYIATKLSTDISGSKIAQNNVLMADNLLQTAEGDLSVIGDNLSRIRDLALTASTEVYDASSLSAITSEVSARVDEINRIASSSSFNGISLFSDASHDLTIQIGSGANKAQNAITISNVFGNASTSALGLINSGTVPVGGISVHTVASAFQSSDVARQFIVNIDYALNEVATRRTELGSYQNRFGSVSDALTTKVQNYSSAKSAIMDADIAEESSNYINSQILQQASSSLLASANQAPSIALSLI